MKAGTSQLARSTPGRRAPVDREISIRPVDAAHGPGLADFYAHLSPRSARLRFLGPTRPGPAQIADLAEAPGLVGVLAEYGPRDGEIVAHASIHADGHGGAEVAFAVADEFQGQGIGSRLVAMTLSEAKGRGLHSVSAVLSADNVPMRRLLRRAGPAVAGDELDAGIEEITLDLARAA
ncbi:MAG TPA: GNAT family N-acetyltransferase [Candidatus Limnocylindria bacterium]|nr:GNAT family N-acetyltransferase [Candidatus Limnocylindria bacterium]